MIGKSVGKVVVLWSEREVYILSIISRFNQTVWSFWSYL